MLALVGLVLSIGLADSLNPSTLAPALYFATEPRRIRRVAEFTGAFFAVNLLVGAVLTFGPGRLLLALIPEPGASAKHAFELIAGAVLLAMAAILWFSRRRLAARSDRGAPGRRGSAAALGASIAALELPTAIPYFVVVAAIVGSDAAIPAQLGLLVLFNVAFVAPLLALIGGLALLGDRADAGFERANTWLRAHWPVLLGSLFGAVGVVLVALGATGLA